MTPGYQALRDNVAWLDLSGRGKILVRGEDRVRLLHALTTNHIEQLRPGEGCYAFFLDAQGHILGDVYLYIKTLDLFIDSEPETAFGLLAHIDRHIIADDVTLEDLTATTATVALEGPRSAGLLASLGAPVPAEPCGHAEWGAMMVARVSAAGGDGYMVFLPADDKARFLSELSAAGAFAATEADALVARIENGKPLYGKDFSAANLPQETQLLHAMHFNKGCYLGQEIVERIRARGHVNRLLVRVAFQGEVAPNTGVTSAVFSHALGKTIAFAYLRPEQVRPGSKVEIGGIEGEVLAPGPVIH